MDLQLPCSNVKFTANIFYRLLLDSMKNKRQFSDNSKESIDKLTQTHMFQDLNDLIVTTKDKIGSIKKLYQKTKNKQQNAYVLALPGSLKNAAKKFKYGEFTAKTSTIYLFNDAEIVAEFDGQVRNEYSKAFLKAVEFARRYFDNKSPQNNLLVQKVLYLILNDNSICKSQEFYICSDGSTKTKSDLKNISEIKFESFLLGVWHYLISSQRLQEDLKGVEKIKVNSNYKQLNFNLTFSDKNVETEAEKSSVSQSTADDNNISSNHEWDSFKKSKPKFRFNYNPELAKKLKESIVNKTISYSETQKYCEETAMRDAQIDNFPSEIDRNIDIISILENNDITLSRSIFFYLLAKAIEPVHPKRNKNAVEKLFLDMLNLTIDNSCNIDLSQSLVRSQHDKFRYLKEISSADCLDDESKIDVFSDKICNNYDEALRSMIKIRQKYFCSNAKNESLVVALIEFIRNDNSIDDYHEFIVCSDGSALTKKQLCEIEEIEFEPFLLGVWYYVISQLTAKDSADKHTFDTVFKLSYTHNGKNCERYRSGNIIEQQSDMYVELIYLNE